MDIESFAWGAAVAASLMSIAYLLKRGPFVLRFQMDEAVKAARKEGSGLGFAAGLQVQFFTKEREAHAARVTELLEANNREVERRREVEHELAEHERILEMRMDTQHRAIDKWQAAHPGNDLTWPDAADLMVWLMEQLEPANERIKKLSQENTRIRAALAHSKDPCVYCSLPADQWAECKLGFPGCDRADDAMGCPELGASLEAEGLRAELAHMRAMLADTKGAPNA